MNVEILNFEYIYLNNNTNVSNYYGFQNLSVQYNKNDMQCLYANYLILNYNDFKHNKFKSLFLEY